MTTVKGNRSILKIHTSINDHPETILVACAVITAQSIACYNVDRGWQIAAVDEQGSIYLDCREKTGEIIVIR
jgi:hypothetical protein